MNNNLKVMKEQKHELWTVSAVFLYCSTMSKLMAAHGGIYICPFDEGKNEQPNL